MRYAHITGWGKYLPPTVLTNHDLAEIVDTSDEWIVEHTGIRERRIAAVGDTTASMATAAAQQALERAGLAATDLELIIVSTSSPDRQLPGAAPIVQSMLGAEQAPAFDLRSGCSGFVFGLSVARQYILSGSYRRVLVVGSEIVSRFLNWSDRRTCVLFGDGAGAAVLEGRDTPGGVLFTAMGTQGSSYEALTVKACGSEYPLCPLTMERHWHSIELDGQATARFAIRTLLKHTGEAVSGAGLTWDDIGLFIPHQANLRLIESVAGKLNYPMERVFVNVDRYANMSTAAVPVALCEALEQGRIGPGDNVLLTAFGAGLSWATAVIQWGGAEQQKRRSLARSLAQARQRGHLALVNARLALFERLSQRKRHSH
ncbi:MAG: ketoacyl-ACP synthase III [Chloroflexi bacterium]|nr:ketoacyl-ACP synthase III [Chloroflexota bacterium]